MSKAKKAKATVPFKNYRSQVSAFFKPMEKTLGEDFALLPYTGWGLASKKDDGTYGSDFAVGLDVLLKLVLSPLLIPATCCTLVLAMCASVVGKILEGVAYTVASGLDLVVSGVESIGGTFSSGKKA